MRSDYHIHTHYLGCANHTMVVKDIVARCEELGLASIGITDHVDRMSDIPKHRAIADDIKAEQTPLRVYFGVELNVLDGRSSPYSAQIRDEMGFQFAIGGPHGPAVDCYDPEQIVAIQHRNHLATCEDPLISVLVHPWWFDKPEFDRLGFPWFDDLSIVPQSMIEELADAATATGTAIEISAIMLRVGPKYGERFNRQYLEFLGVLKERGVQFSLASDSHDISSLPGISVAEAAVVEVGICEDRIWHPSGPPFNHSQSGC